MHLWRIVEKLQSDIVVAGVVDSRAEEVTIKMGAKYAFGPRYGKPLNDREFIDFMKEGGGADGR